MKKFKHSDLTMVSKRSIYGLYAYSFCQGILLWYAIEQLFIEELGGGVYEKGLSIAAFFVVYGLFNIPIGAFADRKGRKLSLTLGAIVYTMGVFLLAVAPTTNYYIAFYSIVALSVAFMDGAAESLMYDTLKDENQEKHYSKLSGINWGSIMAGALVANLASGFVADAWGLRSAYLLSLIPLVISVFVAVFVVHEPDHHSDDTESTKVKIKLAAKEIVRNTSLRYILIVVVVIEMLTQITMEFAQPLFTSLSSSAVGLGMFWAAGALGAMTGRLLAHRFEDKTKYGVVGVLLLVSSFFLLSEWWAIGAVIILSFATSLTLNNLEASLQNNSKSSLRSTISSVYGTGVAIFLVPLYVFGGWLGEAIKVNYMIAIISVPLALLGLVYFRKYNKL